VTITFKSKLELHIDILHDLAVQGPLQISNLKDKAKIDGSTLKKRLELLVQNSLVEKRPINKAQVLYAITERGSTILNWFSKLNDALKLEAYAPT